MRSNLPVTDREVTLREDKLNGAPHNSSRAPERRWMAW